MVGPREASSCRYPPCRGLARCRAREALEDLAPTFAHLLAESLGRRAEAFQVAVLEVHSRPLGPEHGERNLHFGGEVGVVLELGVELPCEYEASRGIPGQHLAPIALAPVFAELVPAAVDLGLHDAVLEWRSPDVVFLRPPEAHVF